VTQETVHMLLEAAIAGFLAVTGFVGTRIVKKLDLLDKHETKLQVHDVKLDEHDRRLDKVEAK
jgi:hypothetical protein